METEIADNSVVAIGYIGEELHDSDELKNVELVIVAPGDDDWTIAYAEGTTTAQRDEHIYHGDSGWNRDGIYERWLPDG